MVRYIQLTGLLSCVLSVVFCIGVLACYAARWDAVAAVTLPPFWAWGIIGTGFSIVAWRLHGGRWPLWICAVWLCVTCWCSDDLSILIRSTLRWPTSAGVSTTALRLRVVTLNCAGQVAAAREVGSWKPDVVLLQESPSSNNVSRLAREWFGDEGTCLVGWDCSVVARGQLSLLSHTRPFHYIVARLTLPDGEDVAVVSLRLSPPLTRLDLWSPACWRNHREDRLMRKREMQQLVDEFPSVKTNTPLVVGGDFNCPAGDAVARLLSPRLKDTFREAGIGWGDTGINDFPFSRPDQIWVSHNCRTIQAQAVKTQNSDHRMVVCDLALHP